jgi:hypothetical protein
MEKGPFKLRSGNKPSISKMAGVSPMKELSESDKETMKRNKERQLNADKKIKSGELKPMSPSEVSNFKDTDKLNYYRHGDEIISRIKR